MRRSLTVDTTDFELGARVRGGVFINYRSEDTQSYGAMLYQELVRHFGRDLVFLDSQSIPAGADFAQEILGRVRSARVVLAVVGPRWSTAADPSGRRRIDDPEDWIRRELVTALQAGVLVIPILTDDAPPLEADRLPDDIAALAGRQFRRLRHRDAEQDLRRIVEEISKLIPRLPPGGLAGIADELARSVENRSRDEDDRTGVRQPTALSVSWRTADGTITDHWSNIRRAKDRKNVDTLDLDGSGDEIADVYRRIESGRLVVLGRAGSGKTVLGLRFVQAMLETRASGGPVPLIFSFGSWNPAVQPLAHWLSGQLCRDHPGLAALGGGGKTLAAELVGRGLILPVLDGFDEIARGLHEAALKKLSATRLPLVLTSRTDEYAAAAKEKKPLTSAAVIELNDLTLDSAEDYLILSSPKAVTSEWERVLSELRRDPEAPASANVITVLSTPLMVALARTVYNETGAARRRDEPALRPAGLLDTTLFSTPEQIENHLVGSFIPSVYASSGVPGWSPERAERWLGFLAAHLQQLKKPDLEWWELGRSVPRWIRTLVLASLSGYLFGVTTAFGNLPVDLIGTAHGPGFAIQRGLVVGTLHGLVAALVFGLIYWIADRNDLIKPSPVRVRLFGRRRARTQAPVGTRVAYGALTGFGVALALLLIDRLLVPRLGLDDGLGGGRLSAIELPVDVALAAGVAFGIMGWLESPIDVAAAVDPADLLRSNRANVASYFVIWAVVLGVVTGIGASFTAGFVTSVETGAVFGVEGAFGAGLGYGLCVTAWGHWFALARIWLPLTGRLPWRLVAFLDDACRRTVLRPVGAVYQFRHPSLKDHLVRPPEPGRAAAEHSAATEHGAPTSGAPRSLPDR